MRKILFVLFALMLSSSLLANEDENFLAGFKAYNKNDFKTAFKYFRQSANNGNLRSQNNLAWMYYHGQGTDKDYLKSFYWYQKAEDSGEPLVLYMLGQHYLSGKGTNKNKDKAYEYYHRAHGKGLPVADLRVGLDYYFGISVDKNYKKAQELVNGAANSGHPAAQFFAGYLELEQANKDKAIQWLNASDKQGYHLASLMLASIAENEGNYMQAAKKIVSAMPLLRAPSVSFEVE